MTAARDACLRLLHGSLWCVFLVGGYGSGKTHLAIATLNEWCREGNYGVFFKVPDLLALLRKRVAVEPEERVRNSEELLTLLAGYSMLALDDLGVEKVTDWGGEQLYRLIDRRYDSHLRTIVTSNARQEELDPRIVSRLREGLIVCRGQDRRGKAI